MNKINKNLNDIIKNYIPIKTNSDRISKIFSSALSGIKYPEDGNHVSELTDLSSMHSLLWIKFKLLNTEEGKIILQEKPRINEDTINFNKLKDYKKTSLGFHYYKYMNENNFSPDERPVSKYIPDVELAYICQRYKETHDFYHVLLGYGRTIPDEIAVKWFEALHLRLPSSSLSALFGGLRLSVGENINLYSSLLTPAIHNAKNCKFILGCYFEKHLEEDLGKIQQELNIIPLDKFI